MFSISFFYLLLYVPYIESFNNNIKNACWMMLLVQNWGKMAHLLQQGPLSEISYMDMFIYSV